MKTKSNREGPACRATVARARAVVLFIAVACVASAALWVGREAAVSRAQTAPVPGAAAAAFYNGPANCCESGPRLAIDAQGNVYATGREAYRFLAGGSTPVYRFRTVKYDTPTASARGVTGGAGAAGTTRPRATTRTGCR